MWDTRVQSLGREDPLEKDMATHSSILAWRIPWTEEPGRQCPWGHKVSDMTQWLTLSLFLLPHPGMYISLALPCSQNLLQGYNFEIEMCAKTVWTELK